jgi:hypothetical protein
MSTQESESGMHATLARRAQLNGFWGGIVGAVLSGVILALISAIFPAFWEWVWQIRLPSGAIVAFDRADLKSAPHCPQGWIFYDRLVGKVVIGADEKTYMLQDEGGSPTAKISADNLPPLIGAFYVANTNNSNYTNGGWPMTKGVSSTSMPGWDTIQITINNKNDDLKIMPPYRALYYCQKS